MAVKDVNLETLAQVIREKGRPVHVNVLARAAVRAQLEAEGEERLYTPGAQYAEKETIRFKGQLATVKSVRAGGNPKQGKFKILTLVMPDGTERYMAAEVNEAPARDREPVSDREVRAIADGADGLAIRKVVQEAMVGDDRFVWFQDMQGDHWCLAEMLPEVGDEELAQVWPLLQGLLVDGTIYPRPTEELVKAIWGQENDGSNTYLLKAFALNAALQRCRETRWLGDGWVLEAEWQELQERPVLVGPREENVVALPAGVTLDEEEEKVDKEEELKEQEKAIEEDFEDWWKNRRLNATITLRASHYYGNWLPLTQAMRRVFPPRASEADAVIFYHRFGGEEESFQAWVDWDQGRILGSPQMYQAFYEHGIYPGAKLVISHRGNLREYDIRTKPTTKQGTVRIRRVFLVTDELGQPILDEEGHLKVEYEEIDEPRRYEISGEVFIAAASWENLPALFAEADRVGQGYFGLMYEVCCEWWEAGGRKPLYVTADELFQEIHYNRRLVTSTATIPWELWRRLAFEPVGDGKYRFRPEKGDLVRSVGPRRRVQKPTVIRRGPQVKKDSSLEEIARRAQVTVAMRDLWSELGADEQREAALRAAVQAYMGDPAREKVLFLREVAHRKIRELVAKNRLEALTLDEFNRQIWQVGSLKYQGQSHRIDSEEAEALLGEMSIEQLKAAFESGDLETEGNQTWGSYSSVIGSRLGKSHAEMEQVVRDTLRVLLYGEGPIERRMEQVIREPNGFGINVVSGILHAVHPDEHILYNTRSVDALKALGISWPADWQRNVDTYVVYRNFCWKLQEVLGFRSLTDVDWFMYNVATRRTRWEAVEETTAFLLGLILGKGEISRSTNTVRITLQYGHYKDGQITGGGIAFDEREALPKGAEQIHARLKPLAVNYDSLKSVILRQRDLYRHELILEFATDQDGLLNTILSWYPTGSSYVDFDFPTAKLKDAPIEVAKAFMQGYACATGLITDATRAWSTGQHRVFIRAAAANKEILNDVRWLLEEKLNVPVAHIHWHEGRDPQLRVYAEDFEGIRFGVDWMDRILAACAQENRRKRLRPTQNQPRLFD
jgi:hypothetical protein